jgi:hypothetical protein
LTTEEAAHCYVSEDKKDRPTISRAGNSWPSPTPAKGEELLEANSNIGPLPWCQQQSKLHEKSKQIYHDKHKARWNCSATLPEINFFKNTEP